MDSAHYSRYVLQHLSLARSCTALVTFWCQEPLVGVRNLVEQDARDKKERSPTTDRTTCSYIGFLRICRSLYRGLSCLECLDFILPIQWAYRELRGSVPGTSSKSVPRTGSFELQYRKLRGNLVKAVNDGVSTKKAPEVFEAPGTTVEVPGTIWRPRSASEAPTKEIEYLISEHKSQSSEPEELTKFCFEAPGTTSKLPVQIRSSRYSGGRWRLTSNHA